MLLIHGFTATPVEVRLVGEYLFQHGYTVSGPRLPGHGATPEALNQCSWRDWAEHAADAYLRLKAQCHPVFVGGESMGGLLALLLGSENPEIAGLVAYAPALRAASRTIHLAPLLKHFVRTVKKNRRSKDPEAAVNRRWQGYTVDPVPAVAQLLALQRHVRRRLPKVSQPLLVFQGRLDGTLNINGAEEVIARANSSDKKLVWLDESTHCLALDVEWKEAASQTLAFIQRVGKPNRTATAPALSSPR